MMEISIIFKIAALGIVITVLGQVLKHSGREEMTFLLSLAGLVIVLFWIVPSKQINSVYGIVLCKLFSYLCPFFTGCSGVGVVY